MARRGKNTIVQRIALDGGDQLKKEFAELGSAGEKAFADLKAAADKSAGSMGQRLAKGIADARKELAPLGSAFVSLGHSITSFLRNLALVGGAVAGAVAGVVAFTRSATQAADEVGKAAQGVGLAAEEYQRLQFAAEQSGIEQANFVSGLTRFNQAIGRAAEGNKAYADRFERLGVAVRDANGRMRPTEAILSDVADAFARMPDGAEKAALGAELFGRQIARWLPLLNEGREGIAALGDEFDASIGGFTEAQIALATKVNDAWSAMSRSARNLRHQIGLAFAPSLLRGIEAFQNVIRRNRETIIGFAGDVANQVTPVIADLFNAFTGNDAEVVDRRFVEWRDSILQFGQDVKGVTEGVVVPAFRGIVSAADGVAGALRAVSFGFADFTGTQLLIGAALLKLTGGFRVLRDAINVARHAMVLLARHPLIAGGIVVAAGVGFLFNIIKANRDAAGAADAHRQAMDDLDVAIQAMKDGVPGAEDAVNRLAEDHIKAAEAAIKHAQEEVAAFQAIRQARLNMTLGPDGEERPERASDIDVVLAESEAKLRDRMRELDEFRAKQQAASQSTTDFGKANKGAADEAERAGKVIAGEGEKIIRVFKGMEMTEVVVPIGKAREEVEGLGQAATDMASETTAAVNTVAPAIDATGESIQGAKGDLDAFAAGVTDIPKSFEALPEATAAALEPVRTAFAETAAEIPAMFQTATGAIADAFASAFTRVKSELDGLVSAVTSAISRMSAALSRLKAEIAATKAAAASASSSSDSGSGFASGGRVFGPGTSTSDSIFARLSRGEFVVKTRAVEHYGPQLFAALNSMRLPKDFLRGFNLGGIVDNLNHSMRSMAPVPAFAGGGLAVAPRGGGGNTGSERQRTPINLNIGGQTFQTMADGEVAAALTRTIRRGHHSTAGRRQEFVR